MVTRIVKMTFRTDEVQYFLDIFEQYNAHIRGAEGCQSLQLLRDCDNPSVFFTYSTWLQESYLDEYRNSSLFAEVWARVKPLFAAPAEAWTTTAVFDL